MNRAQVMVFGTEVFTHFVLKEMIGLAARLGVSKGVAAVLIQQDGADIHNIEFVSMPGGDVTPATGWWNSEFCHLTEATRMIAEMRRERVSLPFSGGMRSEIGSFQVFTVFSGDQGTKNILVAEKGIQLLNERAFENQMR